MTDQHNPEFVGRYVSLECPDGDIELDLRGDGSCTIEKRRWDPEQMQHTDTITKTGRWSLREGLLELDLGDLLLRYRRNPENTLSIGGRSLTVTAFDPLESNPDDPIDQVSLVEKSATDSFLLSAAQPIHRKRWWEFWK